jgi:hypothetical protein
MSNFNSTLTQERLKTLLHYNEETGIFTRIISTSPNARRGDVAGTRSARGYWCICIDGKRHYAHRLAWLYVFGVQAANGIDHIDGNPINNRIKNLRDIPEKYNHQNIVKPKTVNRSGFLGVVQHGARWRAAISHEGKYKYIGVFSTPELAHHAYLVEKRRLHPGCTI